MSLLALVEPDGNQCQQRKGLLRKEKVFSPKGKLVTKTAHHFHIDIPQADQLPQIIPPLAPPQEIKHKNGQNAIMVIIHKGEDSRNAGRKQGSKCYHNFLEKLSGLLCFFIPVYQQEGNEKGPQNILVDGIKGAAANGQIKGDFGQKRKQEESAEIFFQIFGVEISFHQHKSKNREGKPSNASQPVVSGDDRSPKMIAEHKHHRQNVQEGRAYFQ